MTKARGPRRSSCVAPRTASPNRSAVIAKLSLRIMEYYANRVPMPRAQAAHAMAKIDAIDPTRPLHGPVVDSEHHSITLAQEHHFGARLHARPLFCHDEFSPGKVAPRLGKQNRDLNREHVFTVEILMQAVVIAFAVFEDQWRRTQLAGSVAAPDELRVLCGVAHPDSHGFVPAVGHRHQVRVNRRAQAANDAGEWIVEVLILPAPEAMPRHHDPAAEEFVTRVERSDGVAFLRRA